VAAVQINGITIREDEESGRLHEIDDTRSGDICHFWILINDNYD
jgi:hypothetical protein